MQKFMSKIDILLLYPADKINIFQYMIPLGLAGIASVLEQNQFSVKVIDFTCYKGDLSKDIRRWSPSLVGIGGTTPTRKACFKLSKIIKQYSLGIPVVYGGPHASFTSRDTLENVPCIDYIIKGEGEYSFLSLCNKLLRSFDTSLKDIPGLAFRENDMIVETKTTRIEDIDSLPLPARHLFPDMPPLKLDFFNLDSDFLMTSRGCPACCTFCSASKMFPGGVRYRSAEKVQSEIEQILSRRNVGGLKLFDSTFTSNTDHVMDFCTVVKPYKLLWECEIRADDVVTDEMLKTMHDAGCCYINMGVETVDTQLQRNLCKNIDLQKAEHILDTCKKTGIKTKVFFTFGHPGQVYGQCLKDLKYMRKQKGKIDFFAVTVGMKVYPGTQFERFARSSGYMPEGFSWSLFKAPLENYLILEPGDSFVLRQKGLSTFQFIKIIIRLVMQGTLLTPAYIRETIFKQGSIFLVKSLAKYLRYKFKRTG